MVSARTAPTSIISAVVDGVAPATAGQRFLLANGATVAAATLDRPDTTTEARGAAALLRDAQLGGGESSNRAE